MDDWERKQSDLRDFYRTQDAQRDRAWDRQRQGANRAEAWQLAERGNGYGFVYGIAGAAAAEAYARRIRDFEQGAILLAPDYRDRATKHALAGEFHAAVAWLDKAIAIVPSPWFFIDRAHCHLMLGRLDHAEADASVAIQADRASTMTWAWLVRGQARYRLGKAAQALEDLNEVIGRTHDYAWAFAYRAYLMEDMRDYAAAEKDFSAALQADAASTRALLLPRGRCRVLIGDAAGALSDLTDFLTDNAASWEAYYWRASAYRRLARHQDALDDCDLALAFNDKDAWTYELRARCDMSLGQFASAAMHFETAAEIFREKGQTADAREADARVRDALNALTL